MIIWKHTPLIICALLCLSGCIAATPRQGEIFTADIVEKVTMADLLPNPRDALYNALLQGVTVKEVRERRLVLISCATAPGPEYHLINYLALAPPELDDLALWDYIEAKRGVQTGELGPLTHILRMSAPPESDELTTVLKRSEVLCREDPTTQVIHAKVAAFIAPYEMLRVEWQARDPLRGLNENEVRDGRIVLLECSLGAETNSLFWYARVPEGISITGDLDARRPVVEVRAGRHEEIWHGGHIGPPSRFTWKHEDALAKEHWPIELSTVIRGLPAATIRKGATRCGGGP